MNRTKFLAGILVAAVLVDWIATVFFYRDLPPRIPIHFNFDKAYPSYGPKALFFLFPGVLTFIVAVMLACYPFRRKFNFIGRRRMLRLPEAYRLPIYERVYQMLLMVGAFIVGVFVYTQVSIVQIAFGLRDELMIWPVLVMIAAIVLYVVFDFFMVGRMITVAEYHAEDNGQLEETGEGEEEV